MLGGGRGVHGGELSYEGAGGPLLSGRVKEGRDLGWGPSVTGGEAKDEAIVLGEAVRVHLWVLRVGRGGVLLCEDLGRQGLWDSEDVDVGPGRLCTGDDLLGESGEGISSEQSAVCWSAQSSLRQ